MSTVVVLQVSNVDFCHCNTQLVIIFHREKQMDTI